MRCKRNHRKRKNLRIITIEYPPLGYGNIETFSVCKKCKQ